MKEFIDSMLGFLPEKWRGPAVAMIAASPYITRALYALRNGGGIKGIVTSIWLGTNAPKATGDGSVSKIPALLLLASLCIAGTAVGCKAPNFESGGAYAAVTSTNSTTGEVLSVTEPESALFVADASYRLAYDTMIGVMKFERDNRDEIKRLSPQVKIELDKIRPKIVDVDRRWASARLAYRANPTPAGLDLIKRIIAEISRLVPVAQSQLAPAYEAITSGQ